MAQRLEMLKTQLTLRVIVSIRYNILLNSLVARQRLMNVSREKVDKQEVSLDEVSAKILSSFGGMHKTLSAELANHSKLSDSRHTQSQVLIEQTRSDIIATMHELADQLAVTPPKDDIALQTKLSPSEIRQAAILKSFSYRGMDSRHIDIAETHAKTFSWIFEGASQQDQPWDNFVTWLENGESIYWITGKAASGKSTLMKYICQHERLHASLEFGSRTQNLILAKHFFWDLGSGMQKSQAGLIQSLLYQVFDHEPDLLPRILPDIWEAMSVHDDTSVRFLPESWYQWSLTELMGLFDEVISTVEEIDYCFFIDGLDEFDGDHAEMSAFLKHISSHINVKVCVSSRPLMIFEEEFGKCPNLRLEDLTLHDIKSYAYDNLSSHRKFTELVRNHPKSVDTLLTDIVKTASGVFLWVTLVVKSLREGLTNFDTVADLQKRLSELPPELDRLFSHMLNRVQPKFYFQQGSRLFQIVYQSERQLSAIALAFADDGLKHLESGCTSQQLSFDELNGAVDTLNAKLRTRCAGLLEMRNDKG